MTQTRSPLRRRMLLIGVALASCGYAAVGSAARAADGRSTASTAIALALRGADWAGRAVGSIDPGVFDLGLSAASCAVRSGDAPHPSTLTIIDYSRPSTSRRLWVYDLRARRLLYEELVAHGQGSGDNLATRFSNEPETRQSSLGLFLTRESYVGRNGYSLRLEGLDKGFNDRAMVRAIVMHGASYVSEVVARALGRLGRSWGCPALREGVARAIIDRVKDGSLVFAYYPDRRWLRSSKYFACSHTAP